MFFLYSRSASLQPASFQQTRLQDSQRFLTTAVKAAVPIHLELASMGDLKLIKNVAEQLLSEVDSTGLNEQELATLYEVLGGTYSTFDKNDLVQKVLFHCLQRVLILAVCDHRCQLQPRLPKPCASFFRAFRPEVEFCRAYISIVWRIILLWSASLKLAVCGSPQVRLWPGALS